IEKGGCDLVLAYRDPRGLVALVVSTSGTQFHPLVCLGWMRTYLSQLLEATQCAKITFVLRHDYPGQVCSIAKALEVVGERWWLLIVRAVMNPRRGFDELPKALGIARNTLAARLQRLVDEDILERRAYQRNPERHEYFLTDKGLDLWPALVALLAWGDRHSPTPER